MVSIYAVISFMCKLLFAPKGELYSGGSTYLLKSYIFAKFQ